MFIRPFFTMRFFNGFGKFDKSPGSALAGQIISSFGVSMGLIIHFKNSTKDGSPSVHIDLSQMSVEEQDSAAKLVAGIITALPAKTRSELFSTIANAGGHAAVSEIAHQMHQAEREAEKKVKQFNRGVQSVLHILNPFKK